MDKLKFLPEEVSPGAGRRLLNREIDKNEPTRTITQETFSLIKQPY